MGRQGQQNTQQQGQQKFLRHAHPHLSFTAPHNTLANGHHSTAGAAQRVALPSATTSKSKGVSSVLLCAYFVKEPPEFYKCKPKRPNPRIPMRPMAMRYSATIKLTSFGLISMQIPATRARTGIRDRCIFINRYSKIG